MNSLKYTLLIMGCMIHYAMRAAEHDRAATVRTLLSSCIMLHHDLEQQKTLLSEMQEDLSPELCQRILPLIQKLIASRWCSQEELKKLQIAHAWLHAKLEGIRYSDIILLEGINDENMGDEKNFSISAAIASLLHMIHIVHDRIATVEHFIEHFNERLIMLEKALELLNMQGTAA
jgi:hypothetical protein